MKFNPKARHYARRFALQALYQWQVTQDPIATIEGQFLQDPHLETADKAYFSALLQGVVAECDTLDAAIKPFLDRDMTLLNPVELAVMRMGAYELAYRPEIPYRVIINEALLLAKDFGAEEGYKYVNGILDKVARELRGAEQNIPPKSS